MAGLRRVRDGVVDQDRRAAFAAEGRLRRQAMGISQPAPMRRFNASGQEIAPVSGQQGPVQVGPLSSQGPYGTIGNPGGPPATYDQRVGVTPAPYDENAARQIIAMQDLGDQIAGIQQDAQAVVNSQRTPKQKMADFDARWAQQNQQGRAMASRSTGNSAGMIASGLRPGQGESPYMAGLGAQADQMIAGGAPLPAGMASIPPEQMTAFNRGQMRQPGVYDPGYGQVQSSAPAPGVRPGGYGLYGQESYKNLGSPAANKPVNQYGLRRTPNPLGPNANRPGDANLNIKRAGVTDDGEQVLGTYGQGAKLIRGADGRNRVVGSPATGRRATQLAAARQARIDSALRRREMIQAEKYNAGLRRDGMRPSKEDIARANGKPVNGASPQQPSAAPRLTPTEQAQFNNPESQPAFKDNLGFSPATAGPGELYDALKGTSLAEMEPAQRDAYLKAVRHARQRKDFDPNKNDPRTMEIDGLLDNPLGYEMQSAGPPRSGFGMAYDDLTADPVGQATGLIGPAVGMAGLPGAGFVGPLIRMGRGLMGLRSRKPAAAALKRRDKSGVDSYDGGWGTMGSY